MSLSFFLSFFTRGFARVKDHAHISNFQDTRFRGRISNTRGDHLKQHTHKSFHSKDIRFRASISNTRGDHYGQHEHKSNHPKDTHFHARISNTRGDHFRQQRTSHFIPRTPVFVRVFQTLEVTIFRQQSNKSLHPKDIHFRARISNTRGHFGSFRTSLFIPRTSIFVRVFQTLEVTIFGSIRTSPSSQGHPFSCAYFKHSR